MMSSKEVLKQNTSDQLTTKQQLLKTFIDKGYSIYKIDKEKLIDSALKSNLYFLKRKLNENWSFERRAGSRRNKKFDSENDHVDLARENQFISIKEITNILKKDYSTTPSFGIMNNILKESGYSYVSPQLVPKTDEEIKNKRVKCCKWNKNRDLRNVIFIDECTFYLKPPRGKKWIKKVIIILKEETILSKRQIDGVLFHQMINAYWIFKENMSNTIYENILEDYMPELKRIWKNETLIIMDNHPVHKSLNSLKFYKEKGIKVINFPPYSPDLNPIENIWGKIKKQIMKKRVSDFGCINERYYYFLIFS